MTALNNLWSTSHRSPFVFCGRIISIMSTALYMLCKPLFEAYFGTKDALTKLWSTKSQGYVSAPVLFLEKGGRNFEVITSLTSLTSLTSTPKTLYSQG